jgi:hypothetical protein
MVEALSKGCAGHPWPKDRPDRRFFWQFDMNAPRDFSSQRNFVVVIR